MLEQETTLFGCTHAEVGAWMAEEIGLPNSIHNAIKYHHKPSAAPNDMNMVSLVSLAEALTRTYRPRVEDDGIWTAEHAAILLEFSLSSEILHEIGVQFMEAQPDIERFFSPDKPAEGQNEAESEAPAH
jgi:HD-like signal output (HDOD) protein